MAYKFPECEDCVNHDADPTACDECYDGDNYEPFDEEYDLAQAVLARVIKIKEAA